MVGSELKYAATVIFGAVSTMFQATTRSPWACAVVRNGSTTQAASTLPVDTAAAASGKANSVNLMRGRIAAVLAHGRAYGGVTDVLQVVHRHPLAGQVLRRRDRAVAFTTTPEKSLPASPVEEAPLVSTFSGTPFSRATMREVMLPKPNWNWPLVTPATVTAPPEPACSVRSMPRSLKKPFSLPR